MAIPPLSERVQHFLDGPGPADNQEFVHKLSGAVTSNESQRRLFLMTRFSQVDSEAPTPAPKAYLTALSPGVSETDERDPDDADDDVDYYRDFLEGPRREETKFLEIDQSWPEPGRISELSRADQSGLRRLASQTEYWLKCNDCEPGRTVTVAEWEFRYDSETYEEIGEPTIIRILTISPGSRPGLPIETAHHESKIPATGDLVVRELHLLPVEFIEVTPGLVDEDGVGIPGSAVPKSIPEVNEMVEEPRADQIPNVAYRVLKIEVPEMMEGETVRWSMTPQFTPEGEAQPRFRGQWPQAHPDRFEADDAENYYLYERVSQAEGRTTIDNDGETVVRINLPPIGFNKARVTMEFERYPGSFVEIDFEVPAIVVIDPGHGGTGEQVDGSDANHAVSPTDVLEKDLTLAYGLALRDSLRAKATQEKLKVRILMTRKTDVNLGLTAGLFGVFS